MSIRTCTLPFLNGEGARKFDTGLHEDDDGERMLAIDTYGVWQHTRCAGIDNYNEIPKMFVCSTCHLMQQ